MEMLLKHTGITIKPCSAWGLSRKRVIKILKEKGYLNNENPYIYLNFAYDMEKIPNKIILNWNVELQRDKIRMNKELDRLNIPHPKTYYYPFNDLPNTPDKCVIKFRYGEKGRSLEFTRFIDVDKTTLSENNYIQALVPFDQEFRATVDHLGCIGLREKIGDAVCKNSKTCELIPVHNFRLEVFATQVCRKMNVDFSGVDIGIFMGEPYVIEMNSAPGLPENEAEAFANHLIGLLWR